MKEVIILNPEIQEVSTSINQPVFEEWLKNFENKLINLISTDLNLR